MTAKSNIVGVVLAGGLSRRMGGGDKGLLEIAGRPMLAHVIERLRPQVGAMAINANGDPARFATYGLPVVADTIDGFVGPLAGVLAGMRWAATLEPVPRWVATVSADAPLLPKDLVERLLSAVAGGQPKRQQESAVAGGQLKREQESAVAGGQPKRNEGSAPVAIAQSGGELHPVIGLWPIALADDLDAALRSGLRKVLHWTDRHGTVPVDFPFIELAGRSVDPFFNANTPAELEEARTLLAASARS